jgi:hypothetical protein
MALIRLIFRLLRAGYRNGLCSAIVGGTGSESAHATASAISALFALASLPNKSSQGNSWHTFWPTG